MESFAEVISEVADIVARAQAATAAAVPLLTTGTASPRDLEGLAATSSGIRTQVRALVRQLDQVDAVVWLDVVDGARTIGAWTWQRRSRELLTRAAARLVELERRIGEVLAGRELRIVLVRQGETWQSIAQRELGDWNAWRQLLAANPSVLPGALGPGVSLVIPQAR